MSMLPSLICQEILDEHLIHPSWRTFITKLLIGLPRFQDSLTSGMKERAGVKAMEGAMRQSGVWVSSHIWCLEDANDSSSC